MSASKNLYSYRLFTESLPNLPQLDTFTKDEINIQNVVSLAKSCKVFISTNDTIVHPDISRRFAEQAKVPKDEIDFAGHFLAEDGYSTFPALTKEIFRD